MTKRRARSVLAITLIAAGAIVALFALGLLAQMPHAMAGGDESGAALILGLAILLAAIAAFCLWIAVRLRREGRWD